MPFPSASQEGIAWGVLFNDITACKEQETDQCRSRQMFQALVTAAYLHGLSHERGPTRPLQTGSESLERTSDPIEDWLDRISFRRTVPNRWRRSTGQSPPIRFSNWNTGCCSMMAASGGSCRGRFRCWTRQGDLRRVQGFDRCHRAENHCRAVAQEREKPAALRLGIIGYPLDARRRTPLTDLSDPAFERVYGLSSEQALSSGSDLTWLERTVPEDHEKVSEAMQHVRRDERNTFG